jgi:hypothetical protein
MDRKPKPQPAPSNANEAPDESVSARRNRKEQRQFPENEGLVNDKGRKAADALGGVEGEALEETRAASQRGRTA